MAKVQEFVTYQGRSIPKEHFRVFVYSRDGERLVNSYEEYVICLASKEWFETKNDIPPLKLKKAKSNDPNSQRVCE